MRPPGEAELWPSKLGLVLTNIITSHLVRDDVRLWLATLVKVLQELLDGTGIISVLSSCTPDIAQCTDTSVQTLSFHTVLHLLCPSPAPCVSARSASSCRCQQRYKIEHC